MMLPVDAQRGKESPGACCAPVVPILFIQAVLMTRPSRPTEERRRREWPGNRSLAIHAPPRPATEPARSRGEPRHSASLCRPRFSRAPDEVIEYDAFFRRCVRTRLAQSGHTAMSAICPLSGVKRTFAGDCCGQPCGFFGGNLCASSGHSFSTTARISSEMWSMCSISSRYLWRRRRSAGVMTLPPTTRGE